jgi:hypothetical protein
VVGKIISRAKAVKGCTSLPGKKCRDRYCHFIPPQLKLFYSEPARAVFDAIRHRVADDGAMFPGVLAASILIEVFSLEITRHGQVEQTRVARILRSMGWQRKQRRNSLTKRSWAYYPPEAMVEPKPEYRHRRRASSFVSFDTSCKTTQAHTPSSKR